MSAKECETYTREMLDRIGGPSFEQLLMRIVETMVPTDGGNPPRSPDEYYFAVRDLFPHVPIGSDVVARVLAFAMRMSVLRLEKKPLTLTHFTGLSNLGMSSRSPSSKYASARKR